MVYWKKTERILNEKIRLKKLANTVKCDCDIQVGQCRNKTLKKLHNMGQHRHHDL